MYVVDASVFVARFIPTDVNHVQSRDWFRLLRNENSIIFGPNLLLAEVAGPISRLVDSSVAATAVAKLLRMRRLRLVELDDGVAKRAARLAGDLRLRGADSVYVSVADGLHFPLVTWDSEQLTRGPEAVPVRSPGELLTDMGRVAQ